MYTVFPAFPSPAVPVSAIWFSWPTVDALAASVGARAAEAASAAASDEDGDDDLHCVVLNWRLYPAR